MTSGSASSSFFSSTDGVGIGSSRGVVVADEFVDVAVGAAVVAGFEMVTLVPPLIVGGLTTEGDEVTVGVVTAVVLGLVTEDGVFSADFAGVVVVLVVLVFAVGVDIVVLAGVFDGVAEDLEGVAKDFDGVLAGVLAVARKISACHERICR